MGDVGRIEGVFIDVTDVKAIRAELDVAFSNPDAILDVSSITVAKKMDEPKQNLLENEASESYEKMIWTENAQSSNDHIATIDI